MYLTRQSQSEGRIDHEYATVTGRERGTEVATRKGSPVVFTTTTKDRVFEDDETRFLSVQADDSPEQTHDVIAAHFSPDPVPHHEDAIAVWQEAVRILCKKIPRFRHPQWFTFLADEIPTDEPRARRDAVRFLSLLKAIALCRSYSDGRIDESPREIEINFADYCVAHRILSRAFTSTFAGVHPSALKLARAVRQLNKRLRRPVSIKELTQELDWEPSSGLQICESCGKTEAGSIRVRLSSPQPETLAARLDIPPEFLADPNLILQKCAAIDDEVRYVDPLTGKEVLKRRNAKDGAA